MTTTRKQLSYPDVKTVINLPSDIVRAMIQGLRDYDESDEYDIDFGTYGTLSLDDSSFNAEQKAICFGCAATFTLAELTEGTHLEVMKAYFENQEWADSDFSFHSKTFISCNCEEMPQSWRRLEDTIDSFRSGLIHPLFRWYNEEIMQIENEYNLQPAYLPPLQRLYSKWDKMLPAMHTNTWENHIKVYEAFLAELESAEQQCPELADRI